MGLAALIVIAGCGSSSSEGGGTGTVTVKPEDARVGLCNDLTDAIQMVDSYGRIFGEPALTIGQLRSDVDDFGAMQNQLNASAQRLEAAIGQVNATGQSGTTTTVLAHLSANEHLAAIDDAQSGLRQAISGIDGGTTFASAASELHIAAFALEQAYLGLFFDAGCLSDNPEGIATVRSYTTGLQNDLHTAGYYEGAVDGIYGPATVSAVKALQSDSGLAPTGILDPQTEVVLGRKLADQKAQGALNVAALQGALTATGFYHGPIDGVWSSSLESALVAYQEAQSLPPTGRVDPETLAAILEGSRTTEVTTTTTAPATTTTGMIETP